MKLVELETGANFLSDDFGPPGDVWRVMEWYEDEAGVRIMCLAENLTHPDEETFGAQEQIRMVEA